MSRKNKALLCTEDFTRLLKNNDELWVLDDPVDPDLELAQIQREVNRRKGPAVLFTNVMGTEFPVVTNLYGSVKRIDLAFGDDARKFIASAAGVMMNMLPPNFKKIWNAKDLAFKGLQIGLKRQNKGPGFESLIPGGDMTKLPQIKSWPNDGGGFITLPLVYTQCPVSGKGNLGMYRVQIFDATHAGMHVQIHRGAGFHYFEAEKRNLPLKARIFVGGPPALTVAAIAPLPEDVPELLFASMLMGKKLKIGDFDRFGIPSVVEADFSIQGEIFPHERRAEGPFGDHYGYYSLCHDYPFMKVKSVYHRKNAIFPATIVGRPPQEDHFIAEFLQEILEPLFPIVMPNVKKVWAYEESGVHSLAAAVVKNRYYKEAFTAALRILSEGHLSLTKFLFVTDQDCEIRNFKVLLEIVLERADFEKDLFILSNISQDTLDYTGPKVNKGSKGILMGIGPVINQLKRDLDCKLKSAHLKNPVVFCPGALCVSGVPYIMKKDLAQEVLLEPLAKGFKIIFLLDDAIEACRSPEDFIWHVFTRFEPAADIYGDQRVERFHIGIKGSVVIDCRMKTWYPPVLEEDPETQRKVLDKWGSLLDRF
ncbi:MAG: UbiD family decarboxylase [Deltaproteobacteria bacterium]|nr:UbiD family decarboxylase [Deltaproteobacteria bacterium]